jgi:hypothetical protein
MQALLGRLRRQTAKCDIVRHLRAQGSAAVGELVEKSRFPSFADWRWTTLYDSTSQLERFLSSLCNSWNPQVFQRARDTVGAQKANEALCDPRWSKVFAFVHWLAKWLAGLASWVGGCPCHSPQGDAAGSASCPLQGRRLKQAWAFVSGELRRGLAAKCCAAHPC